MDPNLEHKKWTQEIDQGGLYHCKVDFYYFLHAMEVATKQIIEKRDFKSGFVSNSRRGNQD